MISWSLWSPLAKQKSDVVWRPGWHIEHNYINAQISRTSFFVFCTFFRCNIDSYITSVIWMYKWSRTILFGVFTFTFPSCFFLVGSFLWVGLIVYIPFAGTMLFNVSLSLSFSFFGRHLFVGRFDWEGGALECRTIDCRLRIPLGTSKWPSTPSS